MEIKQVAFSNYKREETSKSQIYLHHTAGNGSGDDVFKFWQGDVTPVATCVAISRDGTIVQGFGSKYWAYHLGLSNNHFTRHGLPYQNLDRISIGIEICNWGFLREQGGKYFNYVNREVPKEEVIVLEERFRNYRFWQKYTDEQIESTIHLLKLWHERYGIDITYKEDQMWAVSKDALKGVNGLYTHNSVRLDKTDIYPDPDLIGELKKL
jgi:N-acetyl-anhydromuramyl-L-alanine amidase AmpD